MGMNELSEAIHNDRDIFAKAVRRAKINGVEEYDRYGVIVYLENEIDCYREKIKGMQAALDNKCDTIANLKQIVNRMYGECIKIQPTTQLEAVQQNTTAEIIKALSDNGYNTITINCYKDLESEEN